MWTAKSHFGNRGQGDGVAACSRACPAGASPRPAGGDAGRRTVNSVRPGAEATLTVPPWASTIDFTIDNPSPLVPSADAAEAVGAVATAAAAGGPGSVLGG